MTSAGKPGGQLHDPPFTVPLPELQRRH
jgi:hypothetical protein